MGLSFLDKHAVDVDEILAAANISYTKALSIETTAKQLAEIANEYLADDAVHLVNGVEFTNEEWVAGYKQDQEVFDNIKHNDANITTMYYNNGKIFTNHWLTWTGNSKISGEANTIHYYGYWEWKDGKIIATGAYMDTQWYFNEIGKYLETK